MQKKKSKQKIERKKKTALKGKDGEKITKKETYCFHSAHQKMCDLTV